MTVSTVLSVRQRLSDSAGYGSVERPAGHFVPDSERRAVCLRQGEKEKRRIGDCGKKKETGCKQDFLVDVGII